MLSRNNGCSLEEEDAVTEGEDDNSCVFFEEDNTNTVTLLPLMMAWYGTVPIGDTTATSSVVPGALVFDDVMECTMEDSNWTCWCPAKTVTLLEMFTSTELPQATSGA